MFTRCSCAWFPHLNQLHICLVQVFGEVWTAPLNIVDADDIRGSMDEKLPRRSTPSRRRRRFPRQRLWRKPLCRVLLPPSKLTMMCGRSQVMTTAPKPRNDLGRWPRTQPTRMLRLQRQPSASWSGNVQQLGASRPRQLRGAWAV